MLSYAGTTKPRFYGRYKKAWGTVFDNLKPVKRAQSGENAWDPISRYGDELEHQRWDDGDNHSGDIKDNSILEPKSAAKGQVYMAPIGSVTNRRD